VETLDDRTLLNAGALDPTFGLGGKVFINSPLAGAAAALAIQSDGKIVAVGIASSGTDNDFAVARYLPNGALDPGFGSGTGHPGVVLTNFSVNDGASAMMIQPNGDILVAGYFYTANETGAAAMARYLPDGRLDSGFGTNGLVYGGFVLGHEGKTHLALQADGKILLAFTDSTENVGLTRYLPNGQPDPSFGPAGANGSVFVDFGGTDFAEGVVVQPNGYVVVAAQTVIGFSTTQFALARFDPSGHLDSHFGTGGKVIAPGGNHETPESVVLQPDGKIVVGGSNLVAAHTAFLLKRFNPDGSLDGSFGAGGQALGDFGLSTDFSDGAALALESDGKLIQAGTVHVVSAAHNNFALLRYNADGSLDATFGSGGKVFTDVAGGSSNGKAVALQADGKIVVAGAATGPSGPDGFALVRYEGDPPPPLPLPPALLNVTSRVSFRIRGIHRHVPHGRTRQRVTITNHGDQALAGPLWLVLDHLPRGVRLRGPAGATTVAGRPGSPFVAVPLPGTALAPGQSISLILDFRNPRGRKLRYTPLLWEGTGTL
jgi:uncharacterized delta-60 repeat protein